MSDVKNRGNEIMKLIKSIITFILLIALGVFIIVVGSGYQIMVFRIGAMVIGAVVVLMGFIYLFYGIKDMLNKDKTTVVVLDQVVLEDNVDMGEDGFTYDYKLKGIDENGESVVYDITKRDYEEGSQFSYGHGGKNFKARVTYYTDTKKLLSIVYLENK